MGRKKKPLSQPQYKGRYTTDYTGNNDDILTFLFRGIPMEVIENTFQWLTAGGHVIEKYVAKETFDELQRNGKSTNYITVKTCGHNASFISLPDMCLLIESRIQAECRCIIKKLTINKFLNV